MRFVLVFIVLCCGSCATTQHTINKNPSIWKISFDINNIDPNGLIGPEDEKMKLPYEFCIPQNAKFVTEIREIDPELKMSRSQGIIGCTKHEYLVLGETDKNHLSVFKKLVELKYVKQIDRTWFE